MEIKTVQIQFDTKGFTEIVDLTNHLQDTIAEHGFLEGQASVFGVGSTMGITCVEYEPGLVKTDLPQFFEKISPYRANYAHHATWGDDNGAAHVRSSLTGSSITVPFVDSKPILGTWQQVIAIDFDTRPRNRTVVIQLIGRKS